MFGRPLKSNLGVPYESDVDYEDFEENEALRRRRIKCRWDKKYRVAKLPGLEAGQTVFVKSPSDIGKSGTVLRKDKSPESYWVRVGQSEIRRNRKHLFLLHDHDENVSDVVSVGDKVRDESDSVSNDIIYDVVADVVDDESSGMGLVNNDIGMANESNPVVLGHSEFACNDDGAQVAAQAVDGLTSTVGQPVSERPAITRSGRASRPKRDPDCVYYK
jgi:hypothetical protein